MESVKHHCQKGWLISGAKQWGLKLEEPLGNKNLLKLSLAAKGVTCTSTFKNHSPDQTSFAISSLSKPAKGLKCSRVKAKEVFEENCRCGCQHMNCHQADTNQMGSLQEVSYKGATRQKEKSVRDLKWSKDQKQFGAGCEMGKLGSLQAKGFSVTQFTVP